MINSIKNTVNELLRQKRLAEAFKVLREVAQRTQNWQIASRLDALEESYRFMIRYEAEGSSDPKRDEIHASITDSLTRLAETAEIESLIKDSPSLYYSTLRAVRMRGADFGKLTDRYRQCVDKTQVYYDMDASQRPANAEQSLLIEKEQAAADIFQYVWVTYPLNDGDANAIRDILTDSASTAEIKDLLLAGLLLSLYEHYNEPALQLLLDTYAQTALTDISTAIKALCCAMLAMHRHKDTIGNAREIGLRIANIADSERGRRDIMTVFLQFIRSQATERISRKVKDELVPKLMKLSPEMRRKMRDGMPSDPEELAKNPEWEEMLNDSGLTEKMQELNKLQAEGNDVFLSSFARLKNYPFFNEIANWFEPFTSRHSSICHVFAGSGSDVLLTMVNASGAFCDSDKYSFALTVATMPESQRSMIMSQFDGQQTQILNEISSNLPDPEKQRENIANKYVQNLYRFHNLYRKKASFFNPFLRPVNLIDVPFVNEAISDTENLRIIAEFYFRQQCYQDALTTFSKLAQMEQPSASDYQKTGFCHEQLKHFAEAVDLYEKVDLMKPDDLWTLKHIAICLRSSEKTEEAVTYYQRIAALQPDDVAVANTLANCLLEANHIEEALKCFFKVDYLAPKGERTLRPIAWCSFLTGNYTQSIDYYTRIIALHPDANDYINRGHALLCSGDIKGANTNYAKALTLSTPQSVIDTITADSHYLTEASIDSTTVALILDKIRYDSGV